MKTLGEIAHEAHRDHFTGDEWGHEDCEVCKGAEQAKWEAAAQAVRAAVGESLQREIIDTLSVGANQDDFDTTEWIMGLIDAECGLNLTDKLMVEWHEKNGAAQDAWYNRK